MAGDTWDGYNRCLGLLNDAVFEVNMAFYRRLNKEMLGAYRAGFEALDIVYPPANLEIGSDADWNAAVTARVGFIPSKETAIRQYPDEFDVESIDLSLLDDLDLDEFRDSWSDFDE